jgi:PAS domain S-box-containing protein
MTDNVRELLLGSERFYQNLMDFMNEGLAICEMILTEDGRPIDYRHLEVNPAFERIMRIPAGQAQGRTQTLIGYADSKWLNLFAQVVKTGEPLRRMDYSLKSDKWFDLRAFSVGGTKFALLIMDITTNAQLVETARAEVLERQRAEAAFKSIFESSLIDIALISIDGTVLDCNQAAVETRGFTSKEEIIGKNCFTFVAATDQAIVKDAWERVLQGAAIKDLELTFIKSDETPFKVLISANLLKDSQGKPYAVLITSRDITKRLEAEMKYGKILETALNGFWISDNSGNFLEVNDAYCRMIGYTRDELLAMSISEIEATESPVDVEAHINFLKQKSTDHFLSRHRRKDGTLIEVEVNATYLDIGGGRVVIFVQDITGQRRMEEALRQSEEKYRQLVESSNSIILRVDKNMNITFMNKYAQRFFGYSETEILGKRALGTIIPEADKGSPELATMAEDIIRRPEKYVTNVHQNLRKNGQLVWVSWTNKAVYDSDGNLIEILSIGNDITQLKQAEEVTEQ